MIKWLKIGILYFGMVFSVGSLFSQETEETPTDDLGNVSDAFQENFFEALKQKGIENYELALQALQKAERAAKDNVSNKAVVYFEMGKNLTYLKRYEEAENRFMQVLETTGERMDVMEALYDVYYEKRDYQAAISLVQKLAKKDEDYKEDLASLYSRTQQYEKALELLDELDESWGESLYRDTLRKEIYKVTGNTEGVIQNLETKIDKNPKNEKDYLNLIFLYSEQGNSEKAFALAKELLKNQPNSQKAHLALYKFYLDEGNIQEALASIKIVFQSSEIEKESKYLVLGDFLNFVSQNPTYENELNTLVPLLQEVQSGNLYEQLGGYFVQKGNKLLALDFYEKGTTIDPDNFSLLKNTILLQIDTQKYTEAVQLSEEALAIFPAQSLLYLLNGVAHNGLGASEKAIESLEMGVDFLLDDPKMEKDFYEQLGVAYQQQGNSSKAKEFQQKAANIQISN